MSEKSFFEKVYETARKIPFGRVCTYGLIARHIGSPQAARMVGWAMNKCSLEKEYVPAHRVVNKKGVLTGKNHFGNTDTMKELLEAEGIVVADNQIQNLKQVLWIPEVEK